MTFTEEKGDLFNMDFNVWTPAHCISVDCQMGAGIAVLMNKMFKLSNMRNSNYRFLFVPGIMVYYNKVFNLITKEKYYDKPTYEDFIKAVVDMRNYAVKNGIKNIVMPRIGCGIDKLDWNKVKYIIQNVFKNTDTNILVKYL